jgi:hypothetical protein
MTLTSYLTLDYAKQFLEWDNLLTFVTLANILGLIGGIFYVASVSMKTVIPLRVAAIASAFFFLGYGVFLFMTRRGFRKGAILFNKGDRADEMFLIVKGSYVVKELGIELFPGQIIGEMGLLTPDNSRTQSVVCTERGHCLSITYDKVRELYFENPEFGFHFLRLTSQRLLQNVARLEAQLAARQQVTEAVS